MVLRTADKYSYILAPQNMQAGDAVACGPTAAIKTGNTLPLSSIPLGTAIHNVELLPGKGGQMARSAGTACTLISRGQPSFSFLSFCLTRYQQVLLEMLQQYVSSFVRCSLLCCGLC